MSLREEFAKIVQNISDNPPPRTNARIIFKEVSDTARVLALLIEFGGDWIDHPYARLSVMWHSRVAELRRRGHQIECRRERDYAGKWDYQYRIVIDRYKGEE